MKLFDFLKLLTKEKFPFRIEYVDWCENVKVTVDTFSNIEIYEFNENGIVAYSKLTETITTEDDNSISTKVQDLIKRPLRTWLRAAEDLQIRFIHPYKFVGIDNVEYEATGLLPDFGHNKGVLITSRKDADEVSIMAGLTNDYHLTGLSPVYYDNYDRENIIETLADWGWIGKTEKPNWLVEK